MSASLSPLHRRRLERTARAAARASYSPYSQFPVGAAVLTGSGAIHGGCNVENAAYGLCNCAEQTAIFSAVAAGERRIRACVVYTPTPKPTLPCGACRQVINEFGPDAVIIAVCDAKETVTTTLPVLLAGAFGPANLVPRTATRKRPGRRAAQDASPDR